MAGESPPPSLSSPPTPGPLSLHSLPGPINGGSARCEQRGRARLVPWILALSLTGSVPDGLSLLTHKSAGACSLHPERLSGTA